MDCLEILSLVTSTIIDFMRNGSTTIGWIAIKICTDIHGPQWMNPIDRGHPLFYHLAPPEGHKFKCPVKYLNMYFINWHKL